MSTFLHYEEAVEACGVEQNPPWPTDLPENRVELAHGHTKIGAFTTEMAVTGGVAGADLSEPVVDPDWHASGWAREVVWTKIGNSHTQCFEDSIP
eukprot:304952-Amphidinium_carterae.1